MRYPRLKSDWYYEIKGPMISETLLDSSFQTCGEKESIRGVSAKNCDVAVVTRDSPLLMRQAVEHFAFCFRRELDFDIVQFAAKEEERTEHGYRAYLFLNRMCLDDGGRVAVIGACCFRWRRYSDVPQQYAMQWMWLHPFERRKGRLGKAWPYFEQRFGRVIPESPFSPAMSEFLKKRKAWPYDKEKGQ